MYYILYGLLRFLSFFPLPVLYLLSDFTYGLMFYVLKYRRKVVMANLLIAFPAKTEKERKRIAKNFYHNLVDTFIETIKFLHWNIKDVEKRFTCNLDGLEEAYKTGKPIHILGMHNMNWEYVNWGLDRNVKLPFLGIYLPVASKPFDKIMYNIRARYGTVLIPATGFKDAYLPWIYRQHILASAADQSPATPLNAYWVNFFNRPTAFVKGAEKGARTHNASVVFGHFYKTKRGHYHLDTKFITGHAAKLNEGEMVKIFAKYVETSIRSQPSNYLWSHRRWKHEYKPEYGEIIE
ncbi:MAG: lipid A biosynthesis acyltransferase [Sphingobacteriales bacterium]|nr:lipid A biosynthesis acyltransferase [Sphingobacteriales bacterium]